MKQFWTLCLICLISLQTGCGKKPQTSIPINESVTVTPLEPLVLEQNKVATNPFITGPQDISFEPVNDDVQKDSPAGELSETEIRTGD